MIRKGRNVSALLNHCQLLIICSNHDYLLSGMGNLDCHICQMSLIFGSKIYHKFFSSHLRIPVNFFHMLLCWRFFPKPTPEDVSDSPETCRLAKEVILSF